eukprot:5864182-Pyramimonas_sp.AAC.1
MPFSSIPRPTAPSGPRFGPRPARRSRLPRRPSDLGPVCGCRGRRESDELKSEGLGEGGGNGWVDGDALDDASSTVS